MHELTKKISSVPLLPGCYIFKDKHGNIIYIGKSKRLKSRIMQYFQSPNGKDEKIQRLVREISDLEYIVTPTETDALVLECRLIKLHKPYYNSQLKHMAIYPFLKIDKHKLLPGIQIVTEIDDNSSEYFGCFYDIYDARAALELISNIWQTPICGKSSYDNCNNRPCLRYHLGKCMAPCKTGLDERKYVNAINEIIKFLKGCDKKTIPLLKRHMYEASKALNFEKAGLIKQQITDLENLAKKSRKFNTVLENRNICLFIRAFREQGFTIYFIKNAKAMHSHRIDDIHNIDMYSLELFANEIAFGINSIENGLFLSKCLLDIKADKLYLILPKKITAENTLAAISKSLTDFCCTK